MRITVALLLIAFHCTTHAAPLPVAARAEVIGALDRLVASGCQFERNGSWYSGAEAKSHLLKKLEYVESKAGIQTAEEFIDKATSTSSSSGKEYKVKCAGSASVESAPWLRSQLQELRAQSAKAQGR